MNLQSYMYLVPSLVKLCSLDLLQPGIQCIVHCNWDYSGYISVYIDRRTVDHISTTDPQLYGDIKELLSHYGTAEWIDGEYLSRIRVCIHYHSLFYTGSIDVNIWCQLSGKWIVYTTVNRNDNCVLSGN